VLDCITVRSLQSAFRTEGSAGGEVTQSTLSPSGEGGPMLHEALQKLRYGLSSSLPILEYFEHPAFGLAYLLRSGWEKLRQAFHGCHALFEELGIVVS